MISNQFVQALGERHGLRPDQIGVHASYGGSPESFKKHGIVANANPDHPTEYNSTFTVTASHPGLPHLVDHYATVRPGDNAHSNPIGKDNPKPVDGPRTGRKERRGSLVFVDLTKAPGYTRTGPTGGADNSGAENKHEGTIPPEAIIHVQRHGRRSGESPITSPPRSLADPLERRSRLHAFEWRSGRKPLPELRM